MSRRAFGPDEEESSFNNINKNSKSKTPVLDNYGRDLTKLALEGLLDPVVGRDAEIDKITQILNKRKKNNPAIIGEPGVGKTVIVEALASRIANKQVDRWLFNKRIIEINLTNLVSGTKYRGDFEERIAALIKEVSENPEVILFIDEVHNIVNGGAASGSMDAANILKPALARGEIRMIGATTFDEYKKTIENDAAIERRFQKVIVDIPTVEDTIGILNNIKYKYENHHNVTYSEEVIKKCVELSDRYITYRNFPDKAVDILDEVGARVKINSATVPESIKNLEKDAEEFVVSKKQAATKQQYEEAAKFRDKEKEVLAKIEEEKIKWEEELKKNKVAVTEDDVAFIISNHTGVPVSKLTSDEGKVLLDIEKNMSNVVIGQPEAVKKISEAIQRSRVGIQDPNKPIASFLFLGSTGVGKTYLAKQLAKNLFNSEEDYTRFDMSEFGEGFSVTKLIGAPPGYVGHEDKGLLTEAVKNKPYSIVLFDEIEKAHPDVWNIFLQILDEGKLSDAKGKEINFKNTIIIMTSNIGTDKIIGKKSLGFGIEDDENKNISEIVNEELKKKMKPEIINRIDEKIVFNVLSDEDIKKIVKLEISKLVKRIKSKGFEVKINDSMYSFIAEVGYDREFGARPLKREIIKNIETPIAKHILKNNLKVGDKITLSYSKKNEEVVVK